ncbi:SRPBCC family protein [Falsiroseomonas oryzae]|uniref:SRPBCC family protein n=1 Tax=Falsiroseomonas oryzae TaxID=2766473 RepID=UPI0022EB11B6|nr:SRPBCC domain-containing protein [Roseomonas sp. MO-31]
MNVTVPSLTLVRRIKAPVSRVWAAWTTPALMMLWFGPHHTRAEEAEADLRHGGRFRVVLREDNGARHEATGLYAEIEPERRLVFSWNWVSTPERVSRVTVELRAIAEGTEVTLTHDRFADADTATRHRRGWTESLERLVALLDGDEPEGASPG